MKNLKRFLAVILSIAMVMCCTLPSLASENDAITETTETTIKMDEDNVEESEDIVEEMEDLVGASYASPDEDSEETVEASDDNVGASKENVGASSTSPDEIVEPEAEESEVDETDYQEEPEEDETDYPEEPEEDETETLVEESETLVGASSTSPAEEIEVNTEDKLFGATKWLSYIVISQYTTKTYHVGDTYDPSDLKIKAYYEDADTGGEEMVEVAYTGNQSKFSFSPDCVSSPFTASTTEENPYELTIIYTDDAGDDASATTAFQVHPATTTTYTVQYNQNLPAGYTLLGGMTWYTDSTTTDLTGSPITLNGSADMTCEDTSGNTRTLQGWNTYSSGAGSSYSFGASINTDAGFIGDTLTLYAMWSDPVAPTTGFMYWKVDGDDNNKTIHYYASPGEGRAAVVIGTNGVEHTSLGSSDREKIKYAVFEDNIAATNLECCFENFKGLESITDLGKLNTSNVTSMRQMFNSAGVKELDLTNFDTSNVTDMYGMFASCENLETIRVSDKFVVDKVSTSNGKFMFSGCEKLVGEKGTKFTDTVTPWGKSYAHIDEGSSNPGLFSGASTPTPPTPAKTIDSISVLSHNTNTITADGATFLPAISQGETFDLNGMVLKVTYNDGSTSTVTYNSTTESQFTISDNGARDPSTITIGYGGKQTTYDYYVQSTPDFYIYINDPASNKKVGFTYIQISAGMIEHIYDNLAGSNTTGFYEINASGIKEAWSMYNKNASPTMTKEQARAAADAFANPLTQDVYWGITYGSSNTGGNSSNTGNSSSNTGGSDISDPTKGPMGDLTINPDYIHLSENLNTSNDIPQEKLVKDDELVAELKSLPENANSRYSNARDRYGNTGYGQWLRVPDTAIWYFYSGDLSQVNGQASGFLANGWYNLGWEGQDKWYYFDANGVMKLGWHQEGDKIYYLQADFSDNWYGKVLTGTHIIDGLVRNFDSNGVLIQ